MSFLSRILGDGLRFRLRELLRKPGFRVAAFGIGSLVLALVAPRVGPRITADLAIELASGAVDDLLNIVAASMLAVTTFSVGIIVQALGSATSNATPRATQLLVADRSAQNAVSVFAGAFIYSVVGIIGLSAGLYDGQARIILFLVTLGVIALIVWSLFRWIDHLHHFGRMSDIISRLEEAATEAAEEAGRRPAYGARAATDPPPAPPGIVRAPSSGYLRHVDIGKLEDTGAEGGFEIGVALPTGSYVHAGETLAWLSRDVPPEVEDTLAGAFSVGPDRSFEQDMRFGLVVLAEVASRSLSAAVNDAGTAVEVLRAGSRVLARFHRCRAAPEPVACRHVSAPDLDIGRAYDEFFRPIARDGAGLIEVQVVLQESLDHLARIGGGDDARRQADAAFRVAAGQMDDAGDLARLRAVHYRGAVGG